MKRANGFVTEAAVDLDGRFVTYLDRQDYEGAAFE
jgi:hypothetical protein